MTKKPKKWRGSRERIGVDGSLHRRILALCESLGLVLVDVSDLGHLSRQVLVFDDVTHMTEITIEDLERPE